MEQSATMVHGGSEEKDGNMLDTSVGKKSKTSKVQVTPEMRLRIIQEALVDYGKYRQVDHTDEKGNRMVLIILDGVEIKNGNLVLV